MAICFRHDFISTKSSNTGLMPWVGPRGKEGYRYSLVFPTRAHNHAIMRAPWLLEQGFSKRTRYTQQVDEESGPSLV